MEADFSGYVTKAGLKCSDGVTILPNAFQHQDKAQVPLVWQHGHTDPMNVLGHMVLENRNDGVYGYGFFNETDKADHARQLVMHKDINSMSIYANELIKRANLVKHGIIREVSLVLAGANPGARIDNVAIRHADGEVDELEDEAIIYTGESLVLQHSDDGGKETVEKEADNVEDTKDEVDLNKVLASFNDEQKQLVHSLLQHASGTDTADTAEDTNDVLTIQDIYDSMTEVQQQVLHYMIGEALEAGGESGTDSVQQDAIGDDNDSSKGKEMAQTIKHNVFEQDADNKPEQHTLSHSDMKSIIADAAKPGNTLKTAVEDYALAHGIEDIDVLFPEAKAISDSPELYSRRQEWVQNLMAGVRKSPFSRIKTLSADITVQEARAKGYITGTLKKEEFFRATKRVTNPTTIYKKQKLDRDDIVDITDFDVVAWLKGEMRIMLDEEVARAILVGDGRGLTDDDKVDEDSIRPIYTDSEVYVTRLTINLDGTNQQMNAVGDNIATNRQYLRGTGLPTMYISETYIAQWLTMRDTLGRRIYPTMEELATELRVQEIVPVQLLAEYPNLIAILVNPVDYVVGATAGGQVSLFDFFDIDYNQQKYLIETRMSGALVKLKSAMVIEKSAAGSVSATPTPPTFNGTAVTIVNTTGVVYRNADTDAVMNAAGSPYAVPADSDITIAAEAASGYYFPSTANDTWTFRNEG